MIRKSTESASIKFCKFLALWSISALFYKVYSNIKAVANYIMLIV